MLYLFVLFLLSCFVFAKFAPGKTFHRDYLDKTNTTAVNGLFVGLVFFSHASGYMTLADTLPNKIFSAMNIGQLMVTTFLFYSGYGLLCSIRAKEMPYVRRIPRDRFFRIWLHFAIAVCLFLALGAAERQTFSLKTIVLAFMGVQAIGNSNWYIFIILVLYLIVFVSFCIARDKLWLGAALVTVVTVGCTLLFYFLHMDAQFFNTMLCFPLGMLYALCKETVEKIVMKNIPIYLASLAILGAGQWFAWSRYGSFGELAYPVYASFFVLLVVLITMKLQINNRMLTFLGTHVFEIYILQRLPMIVLDHFGLSRTHPCLYFLICAGITAGIAVLFQKGTRLLDQKIFRKKQQP